jgi:hypothetical protein
MTHGLSRSSTQGATGRTHGESREGCDADRGLRRHLHTYGVTSIHNRQLRARDNAMEFRRDGRLWFSSRERPRGIRTRVLEAQLQARDLQSCEARDQHNEHGGYHRGELRGDTPPVANETRPSRVR